MTSMLECCLSGAILERRRYLFLLVAGCCLCRCVVAVCVWAVERPQNLDSKASLFWKSDGGLSLFVEFKYLLESC